MATTSRKLQATYRSTAEDQVQMVLLLPEQPQPVAATPKLLLQQAAVQQLIPMQTILTHLRMQLTPMQTILTHLRMQLTPMQTILTHLGMQLTPMQTILTHLRMQLIPMQTILTQVVGPQLISTPILMHLVVLINPHLGNLSHWKLLGHMLSFATWV
jgi:predicted Rossmann fold nucleotide-binding protein DprA/Smf involved in DNA uptake